MEKQSDKLWRIIIYECYTVAAFEFPTNILYFYPWLRYLALTAIEQQELCTNMQPENLWPNYIVFTFPLPISCIMQSRYLKCYTTFYTENSFNCWNVNIFSIFRETITNLRTSCILFLSHVQSWRANPQKIQCLTEQIYYILYFTICRCSCNKQACNCIRKHINEKFIVRTVTCGRKCNINVALVSDEAFVFVAFFY